MSMIPNTKTLGRLKLISQYKRELELAVFYAQLSIKCTQDFRAHSTVQQATPVRELWSYVL